MDKVHGGEVVVIHGPCGAFGEGCFDCEESRLELELVSVDGRGPESASESAAQSESTDGAPEETPVDLQAMD